MTQAELAKLSFAELRDRLKARTDEFDQTDDIDLPEALLYLTTLPDGAHTAESVDALIQLARSFSLLRSLRRQCRRHPLQRD